MDVLKRTALSRLSHRPGPFQPTGRSLTPLALAMTVALSGLDGCSLVQTTVDLPFRAVSAVLPGGLETEAVDPVDLQEDMLRFADNFVISTSRAAESLQRDGQPIRRAELLTIKVALASDIYGIASGSNALANLVGLTVLASAARWRVQDYWLPKVYGVSAEPMMQTLEAREHDIWTIAKRVLKPEMQTELREAIKKWRDTAGNPTGELEAFATNALVNEVTKGSHAAKTSSLPSSVFALLDLDPLAGLDPATRELTETRLFAERALFMGQRMPQLIEWQMELLAMRSSSTPQAAGLLTNAAEIAAAGDRLSRTMEQLPQLIVSEREKIMRDLKSEQQGLLTLSQSFATTLAQGDRMAGSTQQAMQSFNDVLTQLRTWPTDPASKSPPFDIKDYATTAHEINLMSQRLTETLQTFQSVISPAQFSQLSVELDRASDIARTRGEAVVDYAFRRLLLLVLASGLVVVASRLLYRWLLLRLDGLTPRLKSGPSA